MIKRAAICIGVNRAGTMTPLQAAAKGATDFAAWARQQGCETTLLVDGLGKTVRVADIFDVVDRLVAAGTYSQLLIYFSGHGILSAPGTEYWLLSGAPGNPNEAVNLVRSIVDARNSGIPHVVFISDACRSSVNGPPLSGVVGGVIFPNRPYSFIQGEADVYYATHPGDPAYEVPEAKATQRYRGIFTECLLRAVEAPPPELVEVANDGTFALDVITSRKLKGHLEATVPVDASEFSVQLRQKPQVIVETALPKYFAAIQVGVSTPGIGAPLDAVSFEPVRLEPALVPATIESALAAARPSELRTEMAVPEASAKTLAQDTGIEREISRLGALRGRDQFETRTGFTVFGIEQVEVFAQRWRPDRAFLAEDRSAWHVRLHPISNEDVRKPSSIVFDFEGTSGAVLAILPGFIGTVIVVHGRVVAVNYVPSNQTGRYWEYQQRAEQLEEMKAFAAVASLNGRFVVEGERAEQFAARIRQLKGLDPTLGLYAAYAYAQVGRHDEAYSVYEYMKKDEIEVPVPFDVGMLASRFKLGVPKEPGARFAPFCPMLAQGWALLSEGDPMYRPIHRELRSNLLPALWTTLDARGIQIARDAILNRSI